MKSVILALAMVGSTAFGIPRFTIANPTDPVEYIVTACDDTGCDLLGEGVITHDMPILEAGGKKNVSSDFLGSLASATGKGIDAVGSAIDSLASGAVAMGYNEFNGTLSGPAGSITFRYNLVSGGWSIAKKPKMPGGEKPIPPIENGPK